MTVVISVVAGMLSAAAIVTFVRLVRGPSVLDRLVAIDMMLALVVAGLGSLAAYGRTSTLAPVLVVTGLLSFIGSVSVARFLGREKR